MATYRAKSEIKYINYKNGFFFTNIYAMQETDMQLYTALVSVFLIN